MRLYHYVFGVNLSSSGTSDFTGRSCVLEIQHGIQITGSSNNFAGFTDTQVVTKTVQGSVTMYETCKYPTVMGDATSCLKSNMAAK